MLSIVGPDANKLKLDNLTFMKDSGNCCVCTQESQSRTRGYIGLASETIYFDTGQYWYTVLGYRYSLSLSLKHYLKSEKIIHGFTL